MNDNYKDMDFEKINSLLADPEFANWYYNKMSSQQEIDNTNIDQFVKIIQEYSQSKFE